MVNKLKDQFIIESNSADEFAGARGLFPNKDTTYINYNGGNLSGDKCYVAT